MREFYKTVQGKGRDSLLHRNLRLCTEEGVFATPFVVLAVPGNLFIASLLTGMLGIGSGVYGMLVSLPAWFNASQLLVIPFLARFFSSKTLVLWTGFVNAFVWLGFAFSLQWLPQDDARVAARILFGIFAFISASASINGVCWMSWIQEWIPDRVRGKYFGRRNRIIGLTTVLFTWGAGYVVDRYGDSIIGYQLVLGTAGGLRLLSMYLQTHIYTPWSQPEKPIHVGWRKRASELIGNRSFVWFVIFGAWVAFWLNFVGPFTPVFMHQELGLTVGAQSHLLILANLSGAFVYPLWGKLSDRYGCKTIITISAILWMLQNYLWVILTPENRWLLYPMWFWGGMASGGVLLGSFNLVLKLVPKDMKTAGISLNLTVTSVAAALAPVLAGQLYDGVVAHGTAWHVVFRISFFLQASCIILGLLMLVKIREPESRFIHAVSGAFRSLRLTMVSSGFLALANVSLARPLRRGVKRDKDGAQQ